jgi:hypothetical protein
MPRTPALHQEVPAPHAHGGVHRLPGGGRVAHDTNTEVTS